MILHPDNLGKGRAVSTAMEQARGEILLIQDADLEYDPAEYRDPPEADRGRPRGRRLRLALSGERREPRAELLAHRRQPAADAHLQRLHGPEPDGHGHLLQGLPPPRRAVARPGLAALRRGRGVHGEGGARAASGSSRCRSPTSAARGRRGRRSGCGTGSRPSPRSSATRSSRGGRRVLSRGATPASGWPRRSLAAAPGRLALVRDHTRGDSLSADEPVHILSGYFDVVRAARPSSTSSTRR